jgi:hypothetical protein
METVTLEDLKYVRDEVFGPNSVMYECWDDSDAMENWNDWVDSSWRKDKSFKAWIKFQIEMEELFWEREAEGMSDKKRDALMKDVKKSVKAIKARVKDYLTRRIDNAGN